MPSLYSCFTSCHIIPAHSGLVLLLDCLARVCVCARARARVRVFILSFIVLYGLVFKSMLLFICNLNFGQHCEWVCVCVLLLIVIFFKIMVIHLCVCVCVLLLIVIKKKI